MTFAKNCHNRASDNTDTDSQIDSLENVDFSFHMSALSLDDEEGENYHEWTNEPANEIMALITQATSEGSGEPAHPHSLARAFAVRIHDIWK